MSTPDNRKPSSDWPPGRAVTRTETRRGDGEGRRRDILRAAADLLREQGYAALNMRDVAARAGVSPGTPYSYFAGKEEIFATLLTGRLDDLTARLTGLERRPDTLEALFGAILPDFREIYRDFAANIGAWLEAGETADDVMIGLRRAFSDAVDHLAAAAQASAARSGVTLPGGDLTKTFIWATLIGLANVTVSGVQVMYNFSPEALAALAARAITASAGPRAGSDDDT
jgi:AcrR family transcriptional regulator